MKRITLLELDICEKVERIFGLIADKQNYDMVDFCEKWLQSFTLDCLVSYDVLIGRSARNIYETIIEEIGKTVATSEAPMNKEAFEWFGYLSTYWILYKDIKPQDLLKYDIKAIIYEFDILHTYSVKTAIEDIEQNLLKDVKDSTLESV